MWLSTVFLESFMDNVMSYIMDKGADDVVLNGYKRNRLMIRFSRGSLDITRFHDEANISVYIGIKKRRLFTELNIIDEATARENIDKVLEVVDYTPPSPIYPPLPDKHFSYPLVPNTYIDQLDLESIVSTLKGGIEKCMQYGFRDVSGSLIITQLKHIMLSSTGNRGEYRRTNFNLNMRIFKGGNISVTINRETTSPSDLDVVEEIERKVEWIRRFSRVGKVSPGKYNLIMSPVVAGNLFNYLGRLLSAYNILLHNSPFVNKLGERVLDKKLYLYDNPLEAGNPGAASFDMEGIPTKDLSLIEAGVVKNYLHNLLTAKKFEVESTGHAGFVSPEPHSLIVKPSSKMGLEDLLGDVGDGILLSNVWYTRFQNYAVGDFSTLQRDAAFVVKGGEISGVVGGVRVSDNIVRMFSNIVGMTGDAEWVRWWDYRTPAKMPYISVSDVNLTTGL